MLLPVRLPRRTYDGAFHHGMNRGYEGRPIFQAKADKQFFLELLEKIQSLTRIRILAYCVLNNHYHLVLQNGTGRMPEFFKQLNGQYAVYYRKCHGGRGYVFQDRYKSMLIQDDAYLLIAIAYVINNPVAVGLVRFFKDYPWSSGSLYFSNKPCEAVDCRYVEELFGTERELLRFVAETNPDELPTVRSNLGPVIGGEACIPQVVALAERRSARESVERRRIHDKYFDPLKKVFQEFETKHRIKVAELDVRTYPGKKMRAELLVQLKECAGLTYREIARLDLFADLEFSSLGNIYRKAHSNRLG